MFNEFLLREFKKSFTEVKHTQHGPKLHIINYRAEKLESNLIQQINTFHRHIEWENNINSANYHNFFFFFCQFINLDFI